jgi:ribosome biogenesis protein Tsr3
MVGGAEGTLVRYGRNFNPYKYNQYIGASYRQKDRPDGMSLTQQIRPFQKIINHWVNLRNDDVKANVQRRVAVDRALVDDKTIDQINNGESWISLNEETLDAYRSAGKQLSDGFFTLPIQTSTGELLTHDLPFILGQRQETSHISDVFRGAAPPPGTPLGIVQEQLTRNAGAFKPVIRQIVLPFEKISEIMLQYFKSDEFYSSDRIVTIVGKNKYQDVMPEAWKQIGDGVSAVQISPDMMPTDVRFNAVSGADAFAAKTMLNSMIANLFQGLGQVGPEIQSIIAERFNFGALWEHMLSVSGLDIEGLQYTPQEIQQRNQQREAQRQQQKKDFLEQQQIAQQLQKSMLQFQHMLDVEKDRYKQQYRAESETVITKVKIDEEKQSQIEQIVKKIMTEMMAEKELSKQEHFQTLQQMAVEGAIEKQKGVENVSPSSGNNVQLASKNKTKQKG